MGVSSVKSIATESYMVAVAFAQQKGFGMKTRLSLLFCTILALAPCVKAQSVHFLVKPVVPDAKATERLAPAMPIAPVIREEMVLVATMQAGHTVTLTWTASPDAAANPSITYNIYRFNGTPACPTSGFTLLSSTASGVLTATDSNVTVGETLSYEVTAVLNGLESVPSGCASVLLPPSPPGKPTLTHT